VPGPGQNQQIGAGNAGRGGEMERFSGLQHLPRLTGSFAAAETAFHDPQAGERR
jgi:hypothetical protein